MAHNVFLPKPTAIATLALFAPSLLVSSWIIYRDYRIIKSMNRQPWQWVLVGFGIVQVVSLLFGIASIIAHLFKQVNLNWVELAISLALQILSCTNITRLLPKFAYTWPQLAVYLITVISAVLNGVFFKMQANWQTKINSEHHFALQHRNPLAVYELVLLILIFAGSAFLVGVSYSKVRQHKKLSAATNKRFIYFLWTCIIAHALAAVSALALGPVVYVIAGKTIVIRGKEETIVIAGKEANTRIMCLLLCAFTQIPCTICFIIAPTKHLVSRIRLRSQSSIELGSVSAVVSWGGEESN